MDEFKTEQTRFAHHVLPQDSSNDRGSFTGHEAGSGWRWRRDRELYGLVLPEKVLAGNTGAEGTDVKRFSKLDKLRAGSVRATNKDGNL
jgi:hypothetical protein